MKIRIPKIPSKWLWTVCIIAAVSIGAASFRQWWPAVNTWVNRTVAYYRSGSDGAAIENGDAEGEAPDAHAGHDHGAHAGHTEATSLELSQQALRNCGVTEDDIRPIQLETYYKSITVPAVVVERPGRTSVQVATPMTGVIMQVHAVQGEAVDPGAPLFRIRLTHEDLVRAQTDFLKALGELDIERREIARLQEVTRSGAIAGKTLLNREYARDKLTSALNAQREALRLHGLSDQQVDDIARERRLLRELQIVVPTPGSRRQDELRLSRQTIQPASFNQDRKEMAQVQGRQVAGGPSVRAPLILKQLDVHEGQSVDAGETLCSLADYGELFIEGLAFEQDVSQLRKASNQNWRIEALFEQDGSVPNIVEGLEIAYLSNQIDTESRTLKFYVRFPNEIMKDQRANGDRYVEWKYMPGQRLELRIPVEQWEDQIVLPVDAVASEGAEHFVFQQNGDHFDRIPVHVKYRDQHSVVVENDGSIFPGDVIVRSGAHQFQMALKNKSGGGVDPHAGHNH